MNLGNSQQESGGANASTTPTPQDQAQPESLEDQKSGDQPAEPTDSNSDQMVGNKEEVTPEPNHPTLELDADTAREPAEMANSDSTVQESNDGKEGEAEAQEESDPIDVVLGSTPTLPASVYDTLPEPLKAWCNQFDTQREKDVFLTSAIAILSGCLKNVEGIYDQRVVHPNLNCFIIAPPASGKGSLMFSRMLGETIHENLLTSSKTAQAVYREERSKEKSASDGKKKTEKGDYGEPPLVTLFIPGNSSSSAIISHLVKNEGRGIICETEADTLSGSLKQEWGGFSDIIRKTFHHESVSISRRGNDEFFEIKNPQLSVALTGTPSQVRTLIPSAEDGLFSRFLFYAFKSELRWRNVAPQPDKPVLTHYFARHSQDVEFMATFLDANPTTFELTPEQWQTFEQLFEEKLKETTLSDENIAGTVFRMGLSTYRLAMVFSVIRKAYASNKEQKIVCSDQDFTNAVELAKVYLEHAVLMYKQLPKSEPVSSKTKRLFLMALPKHKFTRAQALATGELMDLKPRTVDLYLKELLSMKLLEQPSHGLYRKL